MDLRLVGERIKLARMEKRFTLEQFSEMVGISRNFLWEIEAGRKAPAIQTLYNISKELGISVDYLFGIAERDKWLDKSDNFKINGILNSLSPKELDMVYNLLKSYLENKK